MEDWRKGARESPRQPRGFFIAYRRPLDGRLYVADNTRVVVFPLSGDAGAEVVAIPGAEVVAILRAEVVAILRPEVVAIPGAKQLNDMAGDLKTVRALVAAQ